MSKHRIASIILMLFVLLLGAGCSRHAEEQGKSLFIFAGSANRPPMLEIAAAYEQKTGVEVRMTFGGSGAMLAQLELADKGDIYLPASPDYVVLGEQKKLLIEGSSRTVAYLIPALLTPSGNPGRIAVLADLALPGKRIGIANPETVCVGMYALELLHDNGLLAEVRRNVVTYAASGSKTANLVSLGQVDAVIGWRVFHFWNPERMDMVLLEPEQIPRIAYIPVCIPVVAQDVELSQDFIRYMLSPEGRAIYQKYGYITSKEEALTFAPRAAIGGECVMPEAWYE